MLELCISLLNVRLMTDSATCCLPRLSDQLLSLFRLIVHVTLASLHAVRSLDHVRVVIHQVFDVSVVCRLVIHARVYSIVQAYLYLLKLLQTLSPVQISQLCLTLHRLHGS